MRVGADKEQMKAESGRQENTKKSRCFFNGWGKKTFKELRVCVCVGVRKLSPTRGERVPAVCQPNGQKLGRSE